MDDSQQEHFESDGAIDAPQKADAPAASVQRLYSLLFATLLFFVGILITVLIAALVPVVKSGLSGQEDGRGWKLDGSDINRQGFYLTYQDYMKNEGPTKRGLRFGSFVGMMQVCSGMGEPFTEQDVLKYLGAPDSGGSSGNLRIYQYDWDRFGKRDWVTIVNVENGRVTLIISLDRKEVAK